MSARNNEAYEQPVSLFPEWMSGLTLQQQAVLVMALRGQDGDPKETEWKCLVRALRACILKAAHFGIMLRLGDKAGDYMSLDTFASTPDWEQLIGRFLEREADGTCLHAYTHFMHAAEILAYKHPNPDFRYRWFLCYVRMVERLHLTPETEEELDARLDDFGRMKWLASTDVEPVG